MCPQEISSGLNTTKANSGVNANVVHIESLEEVEQKLVEFTHGILVVDWCTDGVPVYICSLRDDEVFNMVPVLALIPGNRPWIASEALNYGALATSDESDIDSAHRRILWA